MGITFLTAFVDIVNLTKNMLWWTLLWSHIKNCVFYMWDTGQHVKDKVISNSNPPFSRPLERHLDISCLIVAESSPLYIASGRAGTGIREFENENADYWLITNKWSKSYQNNEKKVVIVNKFYPCLSYCKSYSYKKVPKDSYSLFV